MAVAFDAVAHGSTSSAGTSIPNFTLTIGAGVTNGAVIIGIAFEGSSQSGVGVTVGGVSAALVASTTATNTVGPWQTMIFALATGSTHGAQTISVSWTGSQNAAAAALSFSGVNQGTPCNNGTTNTPTTGASATAESVTITSTSGDLTFDWNSNNGPTAPTSPSQTSQVSFEGADFLNWNAGSTGPGTGTATHTWTFGAFQVIAMSGVNIQQASSGPTAAQMIPVFDQEIAGCVIGRVDA